MAAKPKAPTPDELLKPKRDPDIVAVPTRTVLSLGGQGDPNDPEFAQAIGALYGIAYTVRFSRKDAGREVFKVGPLVGEWRAEGYEVPGFEAGPGEEHRQSPPRDTWRWTLQIDMPPDLTDAELADAVEKATTKKKGKLEKSEEARRVELVRTDPVRCARILHVGPYADEPATFARMDAFLAERGLAREPWHVEVYLSDPGRTVPEKMKTGLLAKLP
jgi:hypothetical protein